MISDKKPVRDFIHLLVAHNITHVIITPGSRNAPFSLSLCNHPSIRAFSVVDERSAGFVALGMAQQLHKPVVLICTSGTAALNFAPAIAEAFYQRIPLLVVTADRPLEWIDQGEGQSIRQRNVFSNYVKASYEIAEEANEGDLVWHNVRIMDEAMRLSNEGVKGPVHINFPLRESLYKTIDVDTNSVKVTRRALTALQLAEEEVNQLKRKLGNAKKVMVLAGQMTKDAVLNQSLIDFALHKNVVVLTEAHSNLADESFISAIDRLIMGFDEVQQKNLVPDILITVGQNIISRKIKEYLRKGITEHWHVDISGEGLDTLKHLQMIFPIAPAQFFNTLKSYQEVSAGMYQSEFGQLNLESKLSAEQFLKNAEWSDLKAFDSIMKRIPSGSDLQMGNSSVVRYILLSDVRKDLTYFGNRGVAGIDGCSSTAVGASFITGKLTTLISGDVGFLYDSNAFWNKLVSDNLKIIVINNGGGGIFRIIEGPSSNEEILEKFFETAHERKATELAVMYNISHKEVANSVDLEKGLNWLYGFHGCALLEVHTPRMENNRILKSYFKHIKETALQIR